MSEILEVVCIGSDVVTDCGLEVFETYQVLSLLPPLEVNFWINSFSCFQHRQVVLYIPVLAFL